jgi:sporulation protein YlmC with PRC-barrel domain
MTPLLVSVAASFLVAQEPPKKSELTPALIKSHVGDPARCRASQLIGCAITNSKNEDLGEIQDIVLDSSNQHIAYAVVAFGGFLGMGDKYFAMPWRIIQVSQRGSDDKPRATLGLDRETLKAAPGFDKAKWPDMADSDWAKKVDKYYSSRNEKAGDAGAPEPKGSGVAGKSGVDRAPESKAFVYRRLSKLIGMNVVDAQHGKLADLEDLVVDAKVATVDAALLSFGGTLGIDERMALVPFGALTLDTKKDVMVFPCTKGNLDAMALVDGKWPDLNSDAWLVRANSMCTKPGVDGDGDTIVADAAGVMPVPYADSYDLKNLKTVKGTITTIGTVRIGDRNEERIRLRIRTADGPEVIVYAAPGSFADQRALELRSGKEIQVHGSPVKYGTQTVLVAGSITVDGKSAILRDDEGLVTWAKQ